MELDEKWLQTAAGWQAVKSARQIHAAGAVSAATYDGKLLKGILNQGGKDRVAGMRIRGRTDVDNLCTCPTARRSGGLCDHSVAVALQVILGEPARAAAPGAPAGARAPVAGRVSPAEPELVSVALRVELPPNLAKGWEKGSVVVRVTRCEPGFSAVPEDGVLCRWLADAGLPPGKSLPPMLVLKREQASSFFRALAGHPRVATKGDAFRVSDLPFRRRLRVEKCGEGVAISEVPVSGVTLLDGGRDTGDWALIADRHLLLPVLEGPQAVPVTDLSSGIKRDRWWLALNVEQLEKAFSLDDPDGVLASLEIVRLAPRIQLRLEGSLSNLAARLTFDYVGIEAALGEKNPGPEADTRFPVEHPDQPGTFCVRDRGAEDAAAARLRAAGFGAPDREGVQHLSGERAILSFYGSTLQRLEREWDVVLGDRFRGLSSQVARVRPAVRIEGGAGQDWLTCTLDFATEAGVAIPRDQIQQLLRGGGRGTLRLPDGRRAAVDTEAAEEFEEVLRDCDPEQLAPGRFKMRGDLSGFLAESTAFFGGAFQGESQGAEPLLEISEKLSQTLRPYQLEGVRWMLAAASRGGGAILADEMGLGKTVQVLALLDALARAREAGEPKLALVVCPTSLLQNWESEARRFTPGLRVRVMHGSDRQQYFADLPDSADVAITSYGLLTRDIDRYRTLPLAAAVLDEASFIRNPDTKVARAARKIDAAVRIALTGTPIENSVTDLWSIMRFVRPGYLGGREEFRERFERPIRAAAEAGASASPEQRRLAWRMKPYLLRRLKASVAKDLPEKIEQTVYCELSGPQREAYRRILEEGRENVRQAIRQQGVAKARTSMLTVLLRLRQAACDLRLLGLEDRRSGKTEALAELLREAVEGGHRVLIFSQFVSMLTLLKEELEEREIPFCYLDGATPPAARAAEVAAFQEPHSNKGAFLISLKAGGYGLTLTAADTVIHFDPWWNPAVEAQATDRAHRIGQRKVVTSYKLISRGTVEEKILDLQKKKRGLFDAAIDDQSPLMQGLDRRDLENLLEI